jgi:hypothetical protein
VLQCYAPPALYIFECGYPGLTAGATLFRPYGPASRLPGQALRHGHKNSAADAAYRDILAESRAKLTRSADKVEKFVSRTVGVDA